MKDFTVGKTYPQLINYAIPLILGNFFQLTYNAVDSIILGRFAGKECLAAVGIANPVMNIMIFLIVGICLGASIIMSEFYGAKDEKKLKKFWLPFGLAAFLVCVVLLVGSALL